MVPILRGVVGFVLEPTFIEVKAALLGYMLAQRDLAAIAVAMLGLLVCLSAMNGIAYFEGTKSLWPIYWIVQKSEPGAIRVVQIISNEVLAAEYGYVHRALRFGPFAQNAGNMKVLYDSSGQLIDYQCGFNMLGNSYLFTASRLDLDAMPVFQKYLALHEIGHGSMMGGIIWIKSKWVIFSAALASAFGLAVAEVTPLGIGALCLTLLAAFVTTRRVVVESEAETFADSYALARIIRQNPESAAALIRKLLERIADADAFLSRYDRLINKSRVSNLEPYLERLDRNVPPDHMVRILNVQYLHYLAAGLMLVWIALRADVTNEHTGALIGVFLLLIFLGILFRNHAVRKMHTLDRAIENMLGDHQRAA